METHEQTNRTEFRGIVLISIKMTRCRCLFCIINPKKPLHFYDLNENPKYLDKKMILVEYYKTLGKSKEEIDKLLDKIFGNLTEKEEKVSSNSKKRRHTTGNLQKVDSEGQVFE